MDHVSIDDPMEDDPLATRARILIGYTAFALVLKKLVLLDDVDANGDSPRGPRIERKSKGTEKQSKDVTPEIIQAAFEKLSPLLFTDESKSSRKRTSSNGKDRRPAKESIELHSKVDWVEWLSLKKRRSKKLTKGVIHSLYETRVFLGMAAPHNVVLRFQNLATVSKKSSRREKESDYDQHILDWDAYARGLVAANGGWRSFFTRNKLSEVNDIDPASHPAGKSIRKASDPDSFIQRILALANDRYVQIVASPVAMLWPVWFLKDITRRNQFLKVCAYLNNSNIPVGPRLEEGSSAGYLFLDVNVFVGQMQGLPYPFGFAEAKLGKVLTETHQGECWTPALVDRIAASLKRIRWTPPLLFGGRADQWGEPGKEGENYPVELVQVSNPCPIFAGIYKSDGWNWPTSAASEEWKNLSVVIEKESWAAKAFNELENVLRFKLKELTRQQLVDWQWEEEKNRPHLVAYHFPADIRLQTEASYHRLTVAEIYLNLLAHGHDYQLAQVTTVLASGSLLARQSGMPELIITLGTYLRKIAAVCSHLRGGNQDRINMEVFEQLRQKSTLQKKIDRAWKIEHTLHEVAKKLHVANDASTAIVPADNPLRELMTIVGREMIEAMVPKKNTKSLDEYRSAMQEWAWASLLEYVSYTNIKFAGELFTKGEA